jgi:polar amino acid transport system substrate-binding protein
LAPRGLAINDVPTTGGIHGVLAPPATRRWSEDGLAKRLCAFTLIAISLYASADAHSVELKFTTQDFAPFSYLAGGNVSGPAADMVRAVCEEMKITCTFSLLSWPKAQAEVKAGRANGMFVIGWNESRAKWVHFTPPLMEVEYGFFAVRDNPFQYLGPKYMAGLWIGVYGPSNLATSLEKFRDEMIAQNLEPIVIDMRPDDESGFRKLAHGRLAAVYSNRDAGFALVKKLGLEGKVRYAGTHRKLKYYIGFSTAHNDPKIVKRFDDTYRLLRERGGIARILDQYNLGPPPAE